MNTKVLVLLLNAIAGILEWAWVALIVWAILPNDCPIVSWTIIAMTILSQTYTLFLCVKKKDWRLYKCVYYTLTFRGMKCWELAE